MQVASLLVQLQHWQAAITWCAQTVAAADQLSEQLVQAEALLLSAAAQQALGEAASGLNDQATAVRRLKELGVTDGRLVTGLLEAAAARGALGLAADAEQLVAQALAAAEALAHSQGLKEQLVRGAWSVCQDPGQICLLVPQSVVGWWPDAECWGKQKRSHWVVAGQQGAHQFDSFSRSALTLFVGCSPYVLMHVCTGCNMQHMAIDIGVMLLWCRNMLSWCHSTHPPRRCCWQRY